MPRRHSIVTLAAVPAAVAALTCGDVRDVYTVSSCCPKDGGSDASEVGELPCWLQRDPLQGQAVYDKNASTLKIDASVTQARNVRTRGHLHVDGDLVLKGEPSFVAQTEHMPANYWDYHFKTEYNDLDLVRTSPADRQEWMAARENLVTVEGPHGTYVPPYLMAEKSAVHLLRVEDGEAEYDDTAFRHDISRLVDPKDLGESPEIELPISIQKALVSGRPRKTGVAMQQISNNEFVPLSQTVMQALTESVMVQTARLINSMVNSSATSEWTQATADDAQSALLREAEYAVLNQFYQGAYFDIDTPLLSRDDIATSTVNKDILAMEQDEHVAVYDKNDWNDTLIVDDQNHYFTAKASQYRDRVGHMSPDELNNGVTAGNIAGDYVLSFWTEFNRYPANNEDWVQWSRQNLPDGQGIWGFSDDPYFMETHVDPEADPKSTSRGFETGYIQNIGTTRLGQAFATQMTFMFMRSDTSLLLNNAVVASHPTFTSHTEVQALRDARAINSAAVLYAKDKVSAAKYDRMRILMFVQPGFEESFYGQNPAIDQPEIVGYKWYGAGDAFSYLTRRMSLMDDPIWEPIIHECVRRNKAYIAIHKGLSSAAFETEKDTPSRFSEIINEQRDAHGAVLTIEDTQRPDDAVEACYRWPKLKIAVYHACFVLGWGSVVDQVSYLHADLTNGIPSLHNTGAGPDASKLGVLDNGVLKPAYFRDFFLGVHGNYTTEDGKTYANIPVEQYAYLTTYKWQPSFNEIDPLTGQSYRHTRKFRGYIPYSSDLAYYSGMTADGGDVRHASGWSGWQTKARQNGFTGKMDTYPVWYNEDVDDVGMMPLIRKNPANPSFDANANNQPYPRMNNFLVDFTTTWSNILTLDPTLGAILMGQLIEGLGPDMIQYGSDSIWYGAPQWIIESIRRMDFGKVWNWHFGNGDWLREQIEENTAWYTTPGSIESAAGVPPEIVGMTRKQVADRYATPTNRYPLYVYREQTDKPWEDLTLYDATGKQTVYTNRSFAPIASTYVKVTNQQYVDFERADYLGANQPAIVFPTSRWVLPKAEHTITINGKSLTYHRGQAMLRTDAASLGLQFGTDYDELTVMKAKKRIFSNTIRTFYPELNIQPGYDQDEHAAAVLQAQSQDGIAMLRNEYWKKGGWDGEGVPTFMQFGLTNERNVEAVDTGLLRIARKKREGTIIAKNVNGMSVTARQVGGIKLVADEEIVAGSMGVTLSFGAYKTNVLRLAQSMTVSAENAKRAAALCLTAEGKPKLISLNPWLIETYPAYDTPSYQPYGMSLMRNGTILLAPAQPIIKEWPVPGTESKAVWGPNKNGTFVTRGSDIVSYIVDADGKRRQADFTYSTLDTSALTSLFIPNALGQMVLPEGLMGTHILEFPLYSSEDWIRLDGHWIVEGHLGGDAALQFLRAHGVTFEQIKASNEAGLLGLHTNTSYDALEPQQWMKVGHMTQLQFNYLLLSESRFVWSTDPAVSGYDATKEYVSAKPGTMGGRISTLLIPMRDNNLASNTGLTYSFGFNKHFQMRISRILRHLNEYGKPTSTTDVYTDQMVPDRFDLRNSYTKKTMQTGDLLYSQASDAYDSHALDYFSGSVIVDKEHTTVNTATGVAHSTPRFFVVYSDVKKRFILDS